VPRLLERVAIRRRGTRTGPPDFVGVGTVSSRSDWWLDLLLEHPGVEPRRRAKRALHFFDEFCTREMSEADVAVYHSRFPRRAGRIAGEWTPRYMYDVWTPMLLHRAAPQAKLLVLLSDPVERYRRTIARKVSAATSEEELRYMTDAAGRGRYASQLRVLSAFYERDQILVLQYEQCLADPFGQYARTLRFLGLADDFRPKRLRLLHPQEILSPYRRARRLVGDARRFLLRRSVVPRPDLWPDLELSLLVDLEPDVRELKSMVPELDLALWPSFAQLDEADVPDRASARRA
jgi:hypothetical protein